MYINNSWANQLFMTLHNPIVCYVMVHSETQLILWERTALCCLGNIFSCDQAALQMVFSVCPSVCLSITSDRSDVHAKGQGQRSKVKVTEVTNQLYRFGTVTPVWIHIWWWNDTYSLIMLRRGALLFFKVIRQISRSHGSKNCRIWPRLGVSGL